MIQTNNLSKDFIQLARIALAGRSQDVQLLIHRASKKYNTDFPEMTDALLSLLKESPSRSSPLRKQSESPLPVDIDSRLQLLRIEAGIPDNPPILSEGNQNLINQVISERKNGNSLYRLGLHPTKSVLLTGPPGVGKTLAAKWIASQLNRPLLILDLAAVMSSYLGRTGNNIRYVLDYAKNTECVLLLDEVDAIAKRRDDSGEIGELKRLVTVLLQEIDDWPSSGLLIAATNHPSLLDPAIWRRFEMVVNYDYPSQAALQMQTQRLLSGLDLQDPEVWSEVLSYLLFGSSFSESERQILLLRKTAAIKGTSIETEIKEIIRDNSALSKDQKIRLGCLLSERGILSQRGTREVTGLSRDTIRRYSDAKKPTAKKSVATRVGSQKKTTKSPSRSKRKLK